MEYSPEFEAIMKRLRPLPKSEYNTLENRKLFLLAYLLAPPELKAMFDKGLEEKGLVPKATSCDDNGKPVYSLEELAKFYGQTVDEVKDTINEIKKIVPDSALGESVGAVHRMH